MINASASAVNSADPSLLDLPLTHFYTRGVDLTFDSGFKAVKLQITVNEEAQEVAAGMTVALLLEQLKMEPKYLAVERNLKLIPRAEHAGCVLAEGDRLEIVTLVGGG